MKTMAEHFNRVNHSTLFGNYNQGQVLDETRYTMQQKTQDQFSKNKKLKYGYNNKNNFDTQSDISNYAANYLQGYRYVS